MSRGVEPAEDDAGEGDEFGATTRAFDFPVGRMQSIVKEFWLLESKLLVEYDGWRMSREQRRS